MNKLKKVLYISYDGLTDPLGQSQVLAYMEKLASAYQIFIISCEKKDRLAIYGKQIEERCRKNNISWHPLLYTKSPPVVSTIYDIWKITRKAKKLYQQYKYDIVHCRSYMSALVGLKLKKEKGVKFVFDMRGFWIDEKIEAGSWNSSNPLYRFVIKYLRKKEIEFYKSADAIVTLTEASKQVIVKDKPELQEKIKVIPTCVNLDIFKPFDKTVRDTSRKKLNIPADAFVLLYSGGYGPNYDIDFLIKIYQKLDGHVSNLCLLILSKDGVTGLESKSNGLNIVSVSLPYTEVSSFLMAGDLGVINYTNHFSVAGRSPTKLGEYWASGLPAIAPKGIGDIDFLFSAYKNSGIIYDDENVYKDLSNVLTTSKNNLRAFANDYFSLEKGVRLYNDIYIYIYIKK